MKRNRTITTLIVLVAFYCLTVQLGAQSIKAQLEDDIDIVVSKKGTGSFFTIQEAINAIPDHNSTRKIIFVENGIYYEKVVVPVTKTNITLIGEDMDSTVLAYDDSPDKSDSIWTFKSYTIRVDANDFQAMNMTFKNSVKSFKNALAVFSNGDRQIFAHCRLIGWKGTYFINLRARNYLKDCFIEGVMDYIHGFGVAVFDSCQIHSARTDSYITLSSTPKDYKFGLVFRNCNITPAVPLSGISLGRPWFYYAKTVIYKSREFEGIMPIGWTDWDEMETTCYLREYKCFGPGSDTAKRKGGKQLTDHEAEKYILDTIFSLSTFPIDPIHDTAEINTIHNRFVKEGTGYLSDYFLKAGRDTFPTYPASDWKVRVDEDTIYQVIKNNTYMIMDSLSGVYSFENLLVDNVPIPGFDTSITLYGIELDEKDTVPPIISAVTNNAVVYITYPSILPDYTSIQISPKNKLFRKLYKVYNSKDSSYWNANLKYILCNTKNDTIHIKPNIYEYTQVLPEGTTTISYLNPKLEITGSRAIISLPASLPGTAIIKTIAIDTNITKEYLINFTFTNDIKDNIKKRTNCVVQNPFDNQIKIIVNLDKSSELDFCLYDINGRIVLSKEFPSLPEGNHSLKLYAEILQKGTYLYNIKINDRIITGKLMKVE